MSERDPSPLISVALCTFNGASHLREQLDSVLSQTHRNVEIIAVDDCSGDATVAILQEYSRRDLRLQVIVNASNVGFKRNFEFAILQCKGDLIAPCDQDDVWLPSKLSDLLSTIDAKMMAYCDSELIDTNGRSLNKSMSDWWCMQDVCDPVAFVMDNCVSGHAMLFRRELLAAALPVPDGLFHDWWLAAVAASLGGIAYCPKKLVRYRQHDANVTNVLRDRKNESGKTSGRGLVRTREIESRLAGLASLSGPHQPLLVEFRMLWSRHITQWFSVRLGLFVVAHRQRVFALTKRSEMKVFRKALGFFFGVRAKRLVKKKKYTL